MDHEQLELEAAGLPIQLYLLLGRKRHGKHPGSRRRSLVTAVIASSIVHVRWASVSYLVVANLLTAKLILLCVTRTLLYYVMT